VNLKILWLDNDVLGIGGYEKALVSCGHSVEVVASVSKAEDLLAKNQYDLVLIDLMIPIKRHEYEEYRPEITNGGKNTGLVFYERCKEVIDRKKSLPVILTIRNDKMSQDQATSLGIKKDCYLTKTKYSRAPDFVRKITTLYADYREGSLEK